MRPIKGWFKARKTLHNRRKVYYEDVYGHKNSEEDLEGVHILDSESDSGSEPTRPRASRDNIGPKGKKSSEPVLSVADIGTIITIDDSDVEEAFIADLRKHAAQSVNDRNVRGDEIDVALLADIYLADEPRRIADDPSDGAPASDDLGGKLAIFSCQCHARTNTAQHFAEQSPLGSRRTSDPESNDHAVVKSTENTGEEIVREAPDQPANTTLESRSQREHSWDPSQGSEYEYSDEEATDDFTNPDVEMENIRYDAEYEDDDLTDEDSSAEDAPKDIIQDEDEDSQDEVRQRSESHNHNPEVIELGNADRTNNQMAQRVTRDHDQSDGHESNYDDSDDNRGSDTNPEPKEASSFQKHKRFGMFAASPAADGEPVAKRYVEPPQRLRDLVERRHVERKQKKMLAKKGRYNLRPRIQQGGTQTR